MTLKTINKSLIEADTKYILHQCNCVTKDSAGIAKAIFNAFPWANTYSKRIKHSKQGTIDVLGNGLDQRYVINAYVQYYPGKPVSYDTYESRLEALKSCFDKIENIKNLESIGIPYMMGCGLAGGNKFDYDQIIIRFTEKIKDKNYKVIIYKNDISK